MSSGILLTRLFPSGLPALPASTTPPAVLAKKCADHGIPTTKDLFSHTEMQLCDLLDLGLEDARHFLDVVSARLCPPIRTARSLLASRARQVCFLPTQLPAVDAALQGGVPYGSITELVGRSGNGKTQLCLTLTVHACLPMFTPDASPCCVVYFDTENKFSAARLTEIASARFPQVFLPTDAAPRNAERLALLMDSVIIFHEPNSQSLLERLQQLDDLVMSRSVSLIVVDSVASLVRKEFGRDTLVARQEVLSRIASALKYLAETFTIPVVVTNQVLGSMRDEGAGTAPSVSGGLGTCEVVDADELVIPALGNTWSHCVNTRILLQKLPGDCVRQEVKIVKSPLAPITSCPYSISAAGIVPVMYSFD